MITYLNFQYTNIFDNSAAKADLDFRQTIDWKTGAKRTFDWLQAHEKIEDWRDFPLYDQVLANYKKQCNELVASSVDLDKR